VNQIWTRDRRSMTQDFRKLERDILFYKTRPMKNIKTVIYWMTTDYNSAINRPY
jgi:hypothetical protein